MQLSRGKIVEVEHERGDPDDSRIAGMRRAMFGPGVSVVVIFPLIGFVLVLYGFRRGLRGTTLLANGIFGVGKLKAKEPTDTRINNRTVYKLTFEFVAEDGKTYEAVESTDTPERLEDKNEELLLYDPFRPSNALMVDDLPGHPEIDRELGLIRPVGLGAAALALIPPGITLLGHGTYACFRYFA